MAAAAVGQHETIEECYNLHMFRFRLFRLIQTNTTRERGSLKKQARKKKEGMVTRT